MGTAKMAKHADSIFLESEGGDLLTKAFHTTVQAEALDGEQPASPGKTASRNRHRRPSAQFEKAALVAAASQCAPLIGRTPSDPSNSRRPSNSSVASPRNRARRPSQGTHAGIDIVQERRLSRKISEDDMVTAKITKFEHSLTTPENESFCSVILPNVVENDDDASGSSNSGSESSGLSSATDEKEELSPKIRKPDVWHLAAGQGGQRRRISERSQMFRDSNLGGVHIQRRSRCFRWWLTVFHPDGPVRFCWDIFMTLSIIFLAVAMPVIFAYFNQHCVQQPFSSLLLVADLSLILDVLVNFTTPWEDGPRIVVMPVDIASRYVQSWFCLDLVSVWPLGLGADPGSAAHRLHLLAKMTKCVKMVYLLPRCLKRFRSPSTSYLKILLPVVLFFHSLACMWRFVCNEDSNVSGHNGSDLGDLRQEYVADLYWVLMTMSTVGYGDIVPQGMSGRIFATWLMFASSLYGGFIISSMSHAMKRVFDDSAEAKVSDAVAFMSTHRVPQDMQRRIALYLRKRVKDEMSLSKPSNLLALLTPALQKELSVELLRSTLAAFPLFQKAPETFLGQLAQAHSWLEALAGELVVEEGQVEQELVFVITGKLMVLKAGNQDTGGVDEFQLRAGSWFGERCLFFQEA
eukprot:TRINITY_DN27693_c0_g1_i1.p1 TRINITY_DN27693_c0_g1~~TRINITY_DN27693_c0_g1_i1.p1  ORF type:complete len:738 (+),score=98.03 TRINITY_DN27693_c0_g1_i1:318-2216(+)